MLRFKFASCTLLRFSATPLLTFLVPTNSASPASFGLLPSSITGAVAWNDAFFQLLLCIISFVDKQPDLADTAVKYVLQHWPASPSMKQLIFLEILNLLLLKMSRPIFKAVRKAHIAERNTVEKTRKTEREGECGCVCVCVLYNQQLKT